MKGIRVRRIELARAEKTNEYGVKTVNRLIESFREWTETGRQYDREYIWEQDMIHTNGETFSCTCLRYKKYAYMEKAMRKYNFELK